MEYEKQIKELEQHMEEEEVKIIDLEAKIYDLTLEVAKKHSFSAPIEVSDIRLFLSIFFQHNFVFSSDGPS